MILKIIIQSIIFVVGIIAIGITAKEMKYSTSQECKEIKSLKILIVAVMFILLMIQFYLSDISDNLQQILELLNNK